MNKDSKEFIDHSSLDESFEEHLNDNKRILFTAPFGSGKSTYLKYFFEENSNNFVNLNLYPIDYSVTQNEDVFELIKFDLLCELLNKYGQQIELEKEEASFLLSAQIFAYEKINGSILSNFLYLSEKINKSSKGLVKAITGCITDINEFKKTLKLNDAELMKKYLESHDNKQGSIYEWDDISKLISNIINRLKTKLEIKNSVLIIDDLDRLDPEHIFRLFNIFSAHYDKQTEENKFGFDKVILVCDIENIKKIYCHKYGSDVEFSGYIDKFYSTNPFVFDNKTLIEDKLRELLKNKDKRDLKDTIFSEQYDLQQYRNLNFMVLHWLIFALIKASELNLRSLVSKTSIDFPQYTFTLKSKYGMYSEDVLSYEFLTIIYIVKSFFPNANIFKEKLQKIASYGNVVNREKLITSNDLDVIKNHCLGICIPFLISPELLNKQDRNTNEIHQVKVLNFTVPFRFEGSRNNQLYATNTKELDLNLFDLIYTTYKKCEAQGFIH